MVGQVVVVSQRAEAVRQLQHPLPRGAANARRGRCARVAAAAAVVRRAREQARAAVLQTDTYGWNE